MHTYAQHNVTKSTSSSSVAAPPSPAAAAATGGGNGSGTHDAAPDAFLDKGSVETSGDFHRLKLHALKFCTGDGIGKTNRRFGGEILAQSIMHRFVSSSDLRFISQCQVTAR